MQRTVRFLSGLFALVALCLMALVRPAEAADMKVQYCSSQNTGADSQELLHDWQSNGWCYDQCKMDYAFAIVQDLSCWCSNYIPSDQASTDDCNENCPGYPSEKCGNKDKGLYGYIALPKKPSGTQGVSTTSSLTTLKTTMKSSSSSSTTSTAPTTPSSSEPIIKTVTVPGGSVILQTVVPTAPASTKKVAIPAGTIAGIVVGVVLGLFLVIGLILFALWRYRKSKKQNEPSIQRNTSTLSRTGLLKTPVIDTSMTNQSNDKDDTPISNHRDSGFLRPDMLRHNISRNSVNTINDNEDYSRPLKIRNPDPDQ